MYRVATSCTKGSTLDTLLGSEGSVKFVCKSLIRQFLLKNLTVRDTLFTGFLEARIGAGKMLDSVTVKLPQIKWVNRINGKVD